MRADFSADNARRAGHSIEVSARYRASMAKSLLENIEKQAPDLIEVLPQDVVDEIHKASKADWIPGGRVEALYAAVMAAGGEDRLMEVNRRYTRDAMKVPVFGPLIKGATNLFGGGPRGMMRIMPNSWDLMSRDCGKLTVEFPSDHEALIRYSELAAELRTRGFAVSSAASALGVFDGLGVTGTADIDDSRLASDGLLEILARWTPS